MQLTNLPAMPVRNDMSNNRGLTLVELLIGLLLFAILVAGIGFTFHMVVPSQRTLHINALNNDSYRLAYLFKQDLLNTSAIITPAAASSTAATTLTLKVSLPGGLQHVEYRASGSAPLNQVQRCEKPDAAGVTCAGTDFVDLLSEWDDGSVSLTGNGLGVTRGVDADGNGTFSDRENNMIRVVLVLGQFEGPSGSTAAEVSRRTFILEVLPGGLTPGRISL
jgi:prepilin-type N-terminal cleavage/methylation domain-containing protein